MTDNPPKGFRKLFTRKNLAINAALMVLGIGLEQVWVVQYPGMLLMQALDEARTPLLSNKTVLVTITTEEYEKEFEGKSPLKAERLSTAIKNIRKLRPRLLAVDLDTSHASFDATFRKQFVNEKNIIWARNVVPSREGLKPGGFLGRDSEDYELAGIAGFQRDPDWTVREIYSCVELEGREMQTFHRAIARAYHNGRDSRCVNTRHALANYDIPLLTLREAEQAAVTLERSDKNPIRDKIVILGGTYSNTDYHPSHTGFIPGVKLVATAVESQLASEKSQALAWFQKASSLALDFSLGLLVGWIYILGWSPVRKLLTTLALAGFSLFVPGLLLYWLGITRSNPFVVVLGMLIGQLHEAAQLTGEREEEIRHLDQKIKELEESIKNSKAASAHS